MKLNAANKRLNILLKKRKEIGIEIAELRKIISSYGDNNKAKDITQRNKLLYTLYKEGMKYPELAQRFKLTIPRVMYIVVKIDFLENKSSVK